MVEVSDSNDDYEISGFISLPEVNKSSSNSIVTLVNGRIVRNSELNRWINEGYHSLKPDNRYPVVVLNITVDTSIVDVNIHPTKMDIKFGKQEELNVEIENQDSLETLKQAVYVILATVVVIGIVALIAYKNNIFKEKGIIAVGAMAYGVILMTMLAKAARYCIGEWAYGTNDYIPLLFAIVLLGAILFAVSDLLLGYIIGFGCKKRIVRIINIVTYFVAQILLASSILVVRSAYPLY